MSQYADLEYADSYFETRLHSGLWPNSLAADRTAALVTATRIMDRLAYTGMKAAAFTALGSLGGNATQAAVDAAGAVQELEFPRGTDTEIPADIKIACCEIAYALLDGRDPDADLENTSVISRGFSSVRSAETRDFVLEHLTAGIPSATAWKYLRPYLLDRRNITLSRVN
jgi:hypothetical protein